MIIKISISEIHEALRVMPHFPENPKIIYQLKKVGEHFEISDEGQADEVLFEKEELLNLLNAPCGLVHNVETTDCTNYSKFDVPLIKKDYWRIEL